MAEQEMVGEKVRHVLAKWFGVPLEKVMPEVNLLENFDYGSLDAVTITCELEEKFGLNLEDAHIEEVITVGDWIKLVSDKVMANT